MNILEKIFENPARVKKLKLCAYALMVVLVIIDVFTHRHHVSFFFDRIPGFSAIFGFVSCVLIIVGSKALGKLWLQKKEDYYDRD